MDESPPLLETLDDPRVTAQFYRYAGLSDGDGGDRNGDGHGHGHKTVNENGTKIEIETETESANCHLLGVVHDHPASVGRVERVIEAVDPETVALELPPAALPLYRTYARDASDGDGASSPRFGGEMSAAIRAAPDAEVVGIDAPNWSFCRRLVTRLVADRVSAATARRVISSVSGATREALTCRVAATLNHATSMTVACDDPIEYECTAADPPERQAEHERSHVAGVQALLRSVDTDGSALSYRDETRERCMIDRLDAIRTETDGDVVAVVGIDHLDVLGEALSGE